MQFQTFECFSKHFDVSQEVDLSEKRAIFYVRLTIVNAWTAEVFLFARYYFSTIEVFTLVCFMKL